MVAIIDSELEKIKADGLTPKKISVGRDLWDAVIVEQTPMVQSLALGEEATPYPSAYPTEYKETPLEYLENEADDYLRIETESSTESE